MIFVLSTKFEVVRGVSIPLNCTSRQYNKHSQKRQADMATMDIGSN